MTTFKAISPIIEGIYGKGGMPLSLAEHLAPKIDQWTPRYPNETREAMIRETCWNWFSGGSAAEMVARKIEEALAP